jgi:membrane-associated HD superfamily phosphohydrolase
MTQEQFTHLTAMAAVGLAPIMMTTAGHVSRERLKELAEAAANLAQELSKEARTKYQAANGAP